MTENEGLLFIIDQSNFPAVAAMAKRGNADCFVAATVAWELWCKIGSQPLGERPPCCCCDGQLGGSFAVAVFLPEYTDPTQRPAIHGLVCRSCASEPDVQRRVADGLVAKIAGLESMACIPEATVNYAGHD